MPNFKSTTWTALALLFAALGCSPKSVPSESAQGGMPRVLSTTGMIHDLVLVIAEDRVQAKGLMGPGIDPHMYRATAQDLKEVKAADLILFNGLHLEGKMAEVLEKSSKTKKVVAVTEDLDRKKLIPVEKSYDPHVWFHPELWIQCAQKVLAELQLLLPKHGEEFERRFSQWSQEVLSLSQSAQKEFAQIPTEKRILITSHDAFQYFAKYFPLQVAAVQGISTESEVGLKRLDELVALIQKNKIPTVFVESSVSPKAIEKIAAESGTRIGNELFSDALGPEDSGADYYLGMLQHNLETILQGLSQKRIQLGVQGR